MFQKGFSYHILSGCEGRAVVFTCKIGTSLLLSHLVWVSCALVSHKARDLPKRSFCLWGLCYRCLKVWTLFQECLCLWGPCYCSLLPESHSVRNVLPKSHKVRAPFRSLSLCTDHDTVVSLKSRTSSNSTYVCKGSATAVKERKSLSILAFILKKKLFILNTQ